MADLLRGDYKQSDYGKVILPLTVIRRLDCVLEPTKANVLGATSCSRRRSTTSSRCSRQRPGSSSTTSPRWTSDGCSMTRTILPTTCAPTSPGFSAAARDVIDKFDFDGQITRLDRANLLYLVLSRFADIDLHPDAVSNLEMGYLYEELIRRFSELSNETAGEHFTPREVIRLMVNLLFIEDDDGPPRRRSDPNPLRPGLWHGRHALGRRGPPALSSTPRPAFEVFGQELNDETYAICRSDMMLKGQDASHIAQGNSFSEDGHAGQHFDYLLANPPFGVEWKKVEDAIRTEHDKLGFNGRFGAGLPRINDGVLPLPAAHDLQDEATRGGRVPHRHRLQRLAAVHRGGWLGGVGDPPLDHRERLARSVVALPDQLFYNTGISTYFWIVTNRKSRSARARSSSSTPASSG